MQIKINADLFRIVAGFISTEETRYYLQGVCIQPHQVKGVTMVATDGYRMFVAHDVNGEIEGVDENNPPIVRLDKRMLTMCKADRKEATARTLSIVTDGTATIATGDGDPLGTASKVLIDGTYPNWRRVVPNVTEPAPATFNAAYLIDFAKAATELAKIEARKNGGMAIFGDANGPALIRFMGIENAFGVLMPLRDDTERKLPWFLNAAPAEAYAVAAE